MYDGYMRSYGRPKCAMRAKNAKNSDFGGIRLIGPIGRKMAENWSKMVQNQILLKFFEFFNARSHFPVILEHLARFLSTDGYFM